MKNHPYEVDLTNEETYVTFLIEAETLDTLNPNKPKDKIITPYKDVVENQRKRQFQGIENEREAKSKKDSAKLEAKVSTSH